MDMFQVRFEPKIALKIGPNKSCTFSGSSLKPTPKLLWSKTSGETLGARLRGKHSEHEFWGNLWIKTSGEIL